MPESRRHRGPHPEDARFFAPDQWPRLRSACADLSWLYSRGYAEKSATKIVGDRYNLTERQRIAVGRSACSDDALASRHGRQLQQSGLAGQPLVIDGFNVITTVEAALAGGVLLLGRDGCVRDMASMHGSYRKVEETTPAVRHICEVLQAIGCGELLWLLDQPVSNSGRLKGVIEAVTASLRLPSRVEVVPDPDPLLIVSAAAIASADSGILDHAGRWFNLAARVALPLAAPGRVVDLSDGGCVPVSPG